MNEGKDVKSKVIDPSRHEILLSKKQMNYSKEFMRQSMAT